MYESPSSTMHILFFLAFSLTFSTVSSGIILAVWHLHRSAFDVTALSVQEWIEVAILLASSVVFAGYTCCLGRLKNKLIADSLHQNHERRSQLAQKAAYQRHTVTAIMGLYLFCAIVVSPYLEVHAQFESLSGLFHHDHPRHQILYLIGPLMLALVAYIYTVVIYYVQMDVLSLLGKIVISTILLVYVIHTNDDNTNRTGAGVLRIIGFIGFPLVSILHSLKKVILKWSGRAQLIIFVIATIYVAASIVITWAVLQPGRYHMYLPMTMMISIIMFATMMFFTSAFSLLPFDDKTPDERKGLFPKFGIFARMWVVLPLVHYIIFDSQESIDSLVLFAPLALEVFIALCWAGRYRFNGTFLESVCQRFTKNYVVRVARAIKNAAFLAAISTWTHLTTCMLDVRRRVVQHFPSNPPDDCTDVSQQDLAQSLLQQVVIHD